MTLLLLSFLGGVLTILSPCILPVLPFVFARADQPFVRSVLPMLVGMAITFTGVATLAAVGGGWVVAANQVGRTLALILFAAFGLMLLFPALATRATAPLVALGNRLSNAGNSAGPHAGDIGSSLLLGAATGLLWAPCAGPILGLLLTTAAIQGANVGTSLLLLAYAAGAALSLAIALLAGARVFARLKKSLGAGEWIRRGLGAAVLAGTLVIALGLDTGLLTRLSASSTQQIEQALLERAGASTRPTDTAPIDLAALPNEGQFPSLAGGIVWLNSDPLTPEQLRGKVVLVDFWTYSCINCLRTLPYLRAWAEKYRESGLVIIGVHAPEFAFERDEANVRRAARDTGINYPVVLDNNLAIWRAFDNHYWPAHYFIDGNGVVRHHQFGEGGYQQSEQVIQRLLRDAGALNVPDGYVEPRASGVAASANSEQLQSPETYIGSARRQNFASPQSQTSIAQRFTLPDNLTRNQWGLIGNWTVGYESATLNEAGGAVRFRFHARDLHLVLGPNADGRPIRFRVTLDGGAPGAMHGIDVDAAGNGIIREQRLYQLIRGGGGGDRLFEIEFLDPGVDAFAFTFG